MGKICYALNMKFSKFFTLNTVFILAFLLLISISFLKVYENYFVTVPGYARTMNGRDEFLNFTNLSRSMKKKNSDFVKFIDNLSKMSEIEMQKQLKSLLNFYTDKDEKMLLNIHYFRFEEINNPENVINYYAKIAIDSSFTDNTRALFTAKLIILLERYKNDKENTQKLIEYIGLFPPFTGIFAILKTDEEKNLSIAKLAYNTYANFQTTNIYLYYLLKNSKTLTNQEKSEIENLQDLINKRVDFFLNQYETEVFENLLFLKYYKKNVEIIEKKIVKNEFEKNFIKKYQENENLVKEILENGSKYSLRLSSFLEN